MINNSFFLLKHKANINIKNQLHTSPFWINTEILVQFQSRPVLAQLVQAWWREDEKMKGGLIDDWYFCVQSRSISYLIFESSKILLRRTMRRTKVHGLMYKNISKLCFRPIVKSSERMDTFRRSLEENPHWRLKSLIGCIKSNTIGRKKIYICDLFSVSHAQKAGIFFVRLHKSIYFTVCLFSFKIHFLFSDLGTKVRSKRHWRKWGTALRRSSPKWRRKWDGLKHLQPCQDIGLSVYPCLLCGHLFDVFILCVAIVLYLLYVWCGSSVFLVVGAIMLAL